MKKINFGLLFALFCVLWACADEKKSINSNRTNFKLPVVVDIPIPPSLPPVEEIVDDYGLLNNNSLDIYEFGDTVNLDSQAIALKREKENNSPNPIYDMVGQNDIPSFGVEDSNLLTNLKVVVDNRQAFAYSRRQDVDSFLIAYVVNEAMQKKAILMSGSGFATSLEAENERKEWQTLISRGWYDDNNYWVVLPPKNFTTFYIPQTKGDFKTRLRVKFENGGVAYYSQPYEGFIDKKLLKK